MELDTEIGDIYEKVGAGQSGKAVSSIVTVTVESEPGDKIRPGMEPYSL